MAPARAAAAAAARALSRSFAASASAPSTAAARRRLLALRAQSRSIAEAAAPAKRLADLQAPEYLKVPIVAEDVASVLADMPDLGMLPGGSAGAAAPAVEFRPLGGDAVTESAEEQSEDVAVSEPQVRYARLSNGARVAAIDRQGLCASVGLFVQAGSRYESREEACLPHALELMAFRSSDHLNSLQTLKTMEQLGAAATCRVGREDILYQVDLLREYVPVALPLMLANVLCPELHPDEVEYAKAAALDVQQTFEDNPEGLISELLHVAGYKDNTLGYPLYAEESNLELFTPERIRAFVKERCAPNRHILVGVNVDFDDLCRWASRCYAEAGAAEAAAEAPPPPSAALLPAKYTGGDLRLARPNPLCHMMFGWEVEQGWNGPSLAAITVLQMFLGGGGSFSTGGPGKGMHTRLYTEVLNRYAWVESCQASSVMYEDSGIFTIYATVMPPNADDFVTVLMRIFQSLRNVTDTELNRAKNALKSSIHMNLEMRAVMMEDVGRQLVLSGRVGTAWEFGRMIDAVTAKDLLDVLRLCLKTKPTVIGYGAIEKMPTYDSIQKRFASLRL